MKKTSLPILLNVLVIIVPLAAHAATFPVSVTLRGTPPEEQTIVLSLSKPANTTATTPVSLRVYDADFTNEGALYINGNGPIALFPGGSSSRDGVVSTIKLTTTSSWWQNGNNSLRFVHLKTNGYRIDSITINFTQTDTTPPTVAITAPAHNATVSGSAVTVSANASDNVGVVGVQFKLDGNNLGSEDTSAPHAIAWNTTAVPNGSHALTAVARDAAGNATTAASITVMVSNTSGALYDVPNNDADCPNNCRQIPWKAGSDVWNGGTLPNYTPVTCTGLTEGNGTTDNASKIQTCLNNLSTNQAALIPPGMYYVNGRITIPSHKALRGSGSTNCAQGLWLTETFHGDVGTGSTCTTLKYGPNGTIRTAGSGSISSPVALSSGYTKGSTSIVTSSAPGLAVNDWIIVSELGDPEVPVTWTGSNGDCTWCGEIDDTGYLMSQIMQVTSVSGTTIGLSRPLYYTFKASLKPHLRKLSGGAQKAGVEHMKLWGAVNNRLDPHIEVDGCKHCWFKSIETYNTPNVAKAYPIYMTYSYGNEVRDSYFHYGQGNGADRNYGLGLFGPNSDIKIENNIYRENRHSFSQEGGGSGNVFLYNYVDDNYTDDLSYLGAAYTNHGAHPYMTLFEGNIVSHLVADDGWGSSSHIVLFRNWLWGDETGNFTGFTSNNPDWGFVALEITWKQTFYSVVGNVLGITGLHTNWNNATVFSADCNWDSTRTSPSVYGFGCESGAQTGPYDTKTRTTAILHGNYDYKTQGVAFWDGGANRTLKKSMYYASKPSFFGNCAWPAFGPDLNPMTNTLPAKARYEGSSACQ
jgi:hypothetical protein